MEVDGVSIRNQFLAVSDLDDFSEGLDRDFADEPNAVDGRIQVEGRFFKRLRALGKGGAKNAAVLAAQILALKYPPIAENLRAYREGLTKEAIEKAEDFEKQ